MFLFVWEFVCFLYDKGKGYCRVWCTAREMSASGCGFLWSVAGSLLFFRTEEQRSVQKKVPVFSGCVPVVLRRGCPEETPAKGAVRCRSKGLLRMMAALQAGERRRVPAGRRGKRA